MLVLCCIGISALICLVLSCGYAARHSDRLYFLSLRLVILLDRMLRQVQCLVRLRRCRLHCVLAFRKALRLPTTRQDRALRREEKAGGVSKAHIEEIYIRYVFYVYIL